MKKIAFANLWDVSSESIPCLVRVFPEIIISEKQFEKYMDRVISDARCNLKKYNVRVGLLEFYFDKKLVYRVFCLKGED